MSSSGNLEVAVGAILGETYEITRILGEGGMGSVWQANHLRLPGKRFAVKVLHGQASADREAYARFRREAEIASRIGHPNIIEVLDWNTLPSGAPYLVLEFLDGEDLAARIGRGRLAVDQALSITRQIGSALKAAHAADVIHRDLKPGNVFLVPREVDGEMASHVKVLDFGISKIRNSQTVQTQDAVLLGTPQYMAPEQALGKNHEIDARTDIFALGAILYEMLSGTPPFVGTTLAEVVFKVVYEPVPKLSLLVPDVPPEIEAAIERAMQKSPADRFPDASSFVHALTGRALATTGQRATQSAPHALGVSATAERTSIDPGTVAPDGASSKRSTRWLFLAAAIVVGAGGAFAAVKLLGNEPAVVAPVATVDLARPEVVKVDAPPPKPIEPAKPVDTKPTEVVAKPHEAKTEVVSPAAQAILVEAESALQKGQYDDAIRAARRSQQEQVTSRAAAIIARAYCNLNNLSDAKAAFRAMKGGDRARVVKECKQHQIDL